MRFLVHFSVRTVQRQPGEAIAIMLTFTTHLNLHTKKVCATLSTTSGSW